MAVRKTRRPRVPKSSEIKAGSFPAGAPKSVLAAPQEGETGAGEDLRRLLVTISDVVASQSGDGAGKLFPNGVELIEVELTIGGGTTVKLKVAGPKAAEVERTEVHARAAAKSATVDFDANGEGVLSFASQSLPCLGLPGLPYARDLTVKGVVGTDKFRKKYSNEFGVWMEWAVLIMGNRGIYIHEGADSLATNGGPSAGCIHLAPGNAEAFYAWVDQPVRILISYPW